MKTAFPMLALAALLAGCVRVPDAAPSNAPSSVAGISLEAERANGTVRLMLTNRSGDPIGYNLCSSSMMWRSGDGWTPVRTDLVCTMEIRTLRSGESDTFPYPVPTALQRGEYAFQTRVEVPFGAEGRTVMSNPVVLP